MSLPEEIVGEILVRVRVAGDLFRCARTCSSWSRLADDVRRHRWPGHASFLSGFLTRKSFAQSLLPAPGSVFGPDRRPLASFFPDAVTRHRLKRATPLAARHGLLLVRLHSSKAAVRLAVCNLLAGTCDVLPNLDGTKYRDIGYAILTRSDCSPDGNKEQPSSLPTGYSPLFKVLQIPCTLYTFSLSDARWNTARNICGLPMHANAVVCRGTAHWLVWCKSTEDHVNRLHTLDVDARTCHVSLTKIVIPTQRHLSGTCDGPYLSVAASGRLSLLYLQRPGLQLKICVRQDKDGRDNGGRWLWSRVVELKPPKQFQAERMHLTFLAEKGGMLLVKDNKKNVYVADLKTGVMEWLMYHNHVTGQKIVPYEIYWPTV
ncbi:hypothetical protein VPH35_132471 [Triticum aestivum]